MYGFILNLEKYVESKKTEPGHDFIRLGNRRKFYLLKNARQKCKVKKTGRSGIVLMVMAVILVSFVLVIMVKLVLVVDSGCR